MKTQEHDWITKNNSCPLITHLEKEITVTEDEVNNSVKMLYKLDTLVIFIFFIWYLLLISSSTYSFNIFLDSH
jgi:hypothetical protein